jgi:hypothetical protein
MRWPVQPALTRLPSLWGGCIFCAPLWEGGGTADDLVNGKTGTITSGTWVGQEGVDFTDTTGQKIEYTGLVGEGLQVMSGHAVAHSDGLGSGTELLSVGDYFVLRYAEITSSFMKAVYKYASGWRAAVSTVSSPHDGTIHSLQGIADPGNSDQRVYLDGVLVGSASYSDTWTWTGEGTTTILANHGDGGPTELNGTLRFAALWDRVLTEREIQVLGAFPYAMIEPRGGRLGVRR